MVRHAREWAETVANWSGDAPMCGWVNTLDRGHLPQVCDGPCATSIPDLADVT